MYYVASICTIQPLQVVIKGARGQVLRCLVRYAEGKHLETIRDRANLRYQPDPDGAAPSSRFFRIRVSGIGFRVSGFGFLEECANLRYQTDPDGPAPPLPDIRPLPYPKPDIRNPKPDD